MKEIEFNLPESTLAAQEWGAVGTHPVLLAIHGWLDNAASFSRLAPLLENQRVVAVDLPGHGKSSHRSGACFYAFSDYVHTILSLLATLDRPVILLGHSLGAGVAAFCAALAPESVGGLILIEGVGPHSAPVARAPENLRNASKQLRRALQSKRRTYASVEAMIKARHRIGELSIDSAERLVCRNSLPTDGGYRWRTDRRLLVRSPQYFTEEQVLAFLGEIPQPVLLLVDENGMVVSGENYRQRCSRIRHLQVQVLSGGHHLHLEPGSVDAVARAIEGYLHRQSSEGGFLGDHPVL